MATSVAPHVRSAGNTPAQNAFPSDIRNHEASSNAPATRITQVDMVDSLLSSTSARKPEVERFAEQQPGRTRMRL